MFNAPALPAAVAERDNVGLGVARQDVAPDLVHDYTSRARRGVLALLRHEPSARHGIAYGSRPGEPDAVGGLEVEQRFVIERCEGRGPGAPPGVVRQLG